MILFLYSNKQCEHQAISCIRSMERNITDDMRVVYFTIGFTSSFNAKNLVKIPIPERNYPSFHFYKAEVSLDVMNTFPDETDFLFTDTDILFSPRVDFTKLTHNNNYALGVYGPHEYPYMWYRMADDNVQLCDETMLMQYFGVADRTNRYQWSCFYAFNKNCYEFFEEYTSMCKNEYLLARRKQYFPFHDETAFNVCVWKRAGTDSLGFVFVNTHSLETVKMVEEQSVNQAYTGRNLDAMGADWEYIHDSSKVILYHGFKEQEPTQQTLDYLLSL